MKAYDVDLNETPLPIGPNNAVLFWAEKVETVLQLGEGAMVRAYIMRYHTRSDDDAILLPSGDLYKKPPAVHAAITATGMLLYVYHGRHLKMEGAATPTLSPKGILKHAARLYGVDVNDVAAHYPTARMWLSHRDLTHPATLDGLINELTISQKRKMH